MKKVANVDDAIRGEEDGRVKLDYESLVDDSPGVTFVRSWTSIGHIVVFLKPVFHLPLEDGRFLDEKPSWDATRQD